MARAVHGALAGPLSNGLAPGPTQTFDDRRDDRCRCQAAVAGDDRRCRPDVPGKLSGDPPRHVWAQVVDRHIAGPFRVKHRRLLGPRTDFRQLANLPRGEAAGVVTARAPAAGRVKAGQSPQVNGMGNPAGLARTAVFGGGKVLDHARYFR